MVLLDRIELSPSFANIMHFQRLTNFIPCWSVPLPRTNFKVALAS